MNGYLMIGSNQVTFLDRRPLYRVDKGQVIEEATLPNGLDFFLWGAIKDKVHRTPPTTPEDMRERIRKECSSIGEDILSRVQRVHVQRLRK
ncbi:hypothetical protein J6590_090936 [Homalodisca vitripennis]|nr:hypothetical protein J6590_090936 [Homalodisca vitripennis]